MAETTQKSASKTQSKSSGQQRMLPIRLGAAPSGFDILASLKDAFNSLRKSGQTQTTAGKVFDMVADGIRKTPGMPDSEKATRIARLHDEMFGEMKLDPNRRYSIPRVYTWLEILGFKSKGK